MNPWKEYLRPNTIAEALEALAAGPGPNLVLAGGTDLMLDLQQGNHPPVHTLVDVTSIPEMTCIEVREERLFIGAAVPISRVALTDPVREHAEALVEACRLIGGPQVRNVGTLGGNVAHALPAADGTIAMMCLNVEAEVAGASQNRRVALVELFLGPGKSALRSGQEILKGFQIPLRRAGQASAFRRVMRAQGIALPILNLSAWVEREADRITNIRLACGPAGPTPRRVHAAEEVLRGQRMSDSLVEAGLTALLGEVSFRTSPHRATAEYRRRLAGTLFHEALESAWLRAGQR